jgi:hypothetical protein
MLSPAGSESPRRVAAIPSIMFAGRAWSSPVPQPEQVVEAQQDEVESWCLSS